MLDVFIGTAQIAQQGFFRSVRGVEAHAEDAGGRVTNLNVVRGGEGEERRWCNSIFLVVGLMGLRGGLDARAVEGMERRIMDFSEGEDVSEASGDLFDGHEGEDADTEPQVMVRDVWCHVWGIEIMAQRILSEIM